MTTDAQPQKRRQCAVVADIAQGVQAVSWTAAPIWHRLSPWRGLRPGEGIPDTDRMARTLCGEFIPLAHDVAIVVPDSYCVSCRKEHDRVAALTKQA